MSITRTLTLSIVLAGIGVSQDALAQGRACRPVADRTSEVGCWIMASVAIGAATSDRLFWHLDEFPSKGAADAAKTGKSVVLEALGKTWLFTIAEADWQPAAGTRTATVGPLVVKRGEQYTAQYMEAVWKPGTTSRVHRHPGPEAWYTTAGGICLETPAGKTVGRAGESTIVPEGPPMQLTAIGPEDRRSIVLILHASSQPDTNSADDWTPSGLCKP
jgi:quercetin dioxygenase-like cupin family protein